MEQRTSSSSTLVRTRHLPGIFAFFAILASSGLASAQKIETWPCDLFAASAPCGAAFSTIRSLYGSYNGPLYQVTRKTDNTHVDVGILRDGFANAVIQDTFCANTVCAITKIYDQSPNHNDLTPAPPGSAAKGPGPNGYDLPAAANTLPIMAGGHKVYGIDISPGVGYRNNVNLKAFT
jgi:hypothetical protein